LQRTNAEGVVLAPLPGVANPMVADLLEWSRDDGHIVTPQQGTYVLECILSPEGSIISYRSDENDLEE
jgi:hypothetical protein